MCFCDSDVLVYLLDLTIPQPPEPFTRSESSDKQQYLKETEIGRQAIQAAVNDPKTTGYIKSNFVVFRANPEEVIREALFRPFNSIPHSNFNAYIKDTYKYGKGNCGRTIVCNIRSLKLKTSNYGHPLCYCLFVLLSQCILPSAAKLLKPVFIIFDLIAK